MVSKWDLHKSEERPGAIHLGGRHQFRVDGGGGIDRCGVRTVHLARY